MTCSACGTANREGRKFCGGCGAALVAGCPACGAANEPDERFCGECGHALGAPAAAVTPEPSSPAGSPAGAAAQPPSGTELRHVSVLFCDLVGFTSLSEHRDAEDVRALLSAYFDTARRIVERYGGTVEKFIGDAVMAVWGTSVTREDDAQRAVRAALDLVEAVPAVGEDAGVTGLAAKVGVTTGQVAAWANPGEGLVVGDRVNTAARIQSSADPGTVLVDDVTRHATSAAIAYTDRGAHALKGKAEPLELWQALRVVGYAGGEQRMDGLEAPLVGRARELTMIKELFHGCVEDRRAWLVALSGQAGVGKSRLHWELRKYVDGLLLNARWHTGRCLAYGDGVAYSALSEMVRQRFAIAEDDPPDAVQEKLAAGFVRWIPDTAAHDFLTPRLGALLGIDAPAMSREELFAGWRLLFEQLATQDPVVLVFEDMQWADNGLLDFVEHLLDWSAGHRIFILSLARPELSARRPRWSAARRNATPIYVEPLSDAAMSTLLDELVAGLPAAARKQIVTRAEGLPLYAVETVRGLLDRGVAVADAGRYVIAGNVGDLDVPPTLTALIAARLDALEGHERALVRGLSVLGMSFPRGAIGTVTDLDEAAIDALVTQLMRKDILTLTSDPLSPDRGQYRFVQALLRTAAYDTLPKRERKTHHLRVAEHLRRTFADDGDDIAEVIAAHYRAALDASGADPDVAAIRAKAVEMYIRSAQRAASLGSPENAEHAYLVARDLTQDPDQRVALTELAGQMCTLSGRAERSVELFEEAMAAHRAAGRKHAAAVLNVPLAEALRFANRLDDALAAIRTALDELAADDPARAKALAIGSWVATFAGEGQQAFTWADDALLLAQQLGLEEVLKRAAGVKALACLRDRPQEALMLLRWQLELLDDRDSSLDQGVAHHNLGELLSTLGQPGARAHFEAERSISVRLGDRLGEAIAVSSLMDLDTDEGAWDQAVALAESVMAARTEHVGDESIAAALAVIAAVRGQRETAHRHLDALAAWRDDGDLQERGSYDRIAANVAVADGEYDAALEHAKSALDALLPLLGTFTPGVPTTWVTAATAAYRGGRRDELGRLIKRFRDLPPGYLTPYVAAQLQRFEALQAAGAGADGVEDGLRGAVQQLRALGRPYDAALAELELAQWLAGEGRAADAAALAATAAQTFTALGAEPDLQRAQSLQSGAPLPA